jgi:rRNA-processing protein FCF1
MNSRLLIRQIQRYRSRHVLIDTNLLLLFFIGSLRPDLISSFNRTSIYSPDDFDLLETIFRYFKKVATTPHILTEVSNLMGQCHEPLRSELRAFLAHAIQSWKETQSPSRTLTQAAYFIKFGLTDTAIADLPMSSYFVLTDDRSLAGFLESRKTGVLHFSDLRDL